MKHYRVVTAIAMVMCAAFALTVGLAQAQTGVAPNGPTGGGGPGDVGPGFTYQGQLKNASGLVNGTCDFVFSLWDQSGTGAPPTGGLQIGATITQTAVSVTNGLFTVVLNAAGEFGAEAFNGQARWLGIAVRCPAGGGGYTVLSPRQPLWAAPYAMSLRPGAMISGSVSGATLAGVNTNTGLFTAGVGGQSTSGIGAGVYGQNVASSGYAYGVYGESASTGGRGVYGRATAASGATNGVKGVSDSPTGVGVYGQATGAGTGVEAASASGDAISATGTGIIRSVADTELYLSPYIALPRAANSDLAFSPLENGGVNIYRTVASAGERLVVLPIPVYGKVFGATMYVKSVEVCYKLTSAGPQRIDATGVYKGNGDTYATYLSESTDRTSTTRTCYTVTATTRTAIDGSSYVQLHLYWSTAGSLSDGIRLDTVKLTLTETP